MVFRGVKKLNPLAKRFAQIPLAHSLKKILPEVVKKDWTLKERTVFSLQAVACSITFNQTNNLIAIPISTTKIAKLRVDVSTTSHDPAWLSSFTALSIHPKRPKFPRHQSSTLNFGCSQIVPNLDRRSDSMGIPPKTMTCRNILYQSVLVFLSSAQSV